MTRAFLTNASSGYDWEMLLRKKDEAAMVTKSHNTEKTLTGKRPAMRKAEITRNEILVAAAHLFAEKGYSECNLRELAERVGMKAGSFYYHFKSKEDILDELLVVSIGLVSDAVKKAMAAEGPDASIRSRLVAAMRAHITAFLTRDDNSNAFMRVWEHMSPAMKRRKRETRREYAAIWYDLIEEGIREGLLRDDMEVRLVVPFVIGTMSRTLEWYNPKYMTIDQVCDLVVRIHLDGGLAPSQPLQAALSGGEELRRQRRVSRQR